MVPLLRVHDGDFMDFESFNEKKNVPKKRTYPVTFFFPVVNIRKKALLLKFARTYIVSVLHGLEFVPTITDAQISRCDFLLSKFFKIRCPKKFNLFKKSHPWLDLNFQQKAARRRS